MKDIVTELVEVLELDMKFHSRFFAATSMDDFVKAGYTGLAEATPMRDFLWDLKRNALNKATGKK